MFLNGVAKEQEMHGVDLPGQRPLNHYRGVCHPLWYRKKTRPQHGAHSHIMIQGHVV